MKFSRWLVLAVLVLAMGVPWFVGCTFNGVPFSVDKQVSVPANTTVAFVVPADAPAFVYGVKLDPSKLFKANEIKEKSVLTGPWFVVCGAQYAGYTNNVVARTNDLTAAKQ